MLLTQRADIYRMIPDADPTLAAKGRKSIGPWRRGVACLLVPISSIDASVSFALESTHIVYLPIWFRGLRKEDEIRLSGRIDSSDARVPNRYVVKGIRRFPAFGLQHTAAYCQERE